MNFNEFINNHNITLDCTLIEDTTAIAPQKGDNGTIKWSVTIHCGNRKAEFDYTMGSAYVKYIDKSLPSVGIYKWRKQYVQPDLCNVLTSIQLDASVADVSFDDFCNDFGYSNDSIRALNTYNACVENGRKVRNLFGPLYAEFMQCEEE